MKKIFAIVLAVVLALGMASAFAWSWTCPTAQVNKGKATLAVTPYVKTNDGSSFKWVQATNAAAVSTENVYYVVKLTIPKDVNATWYSYIGDLSLTLAKGGFALSKDAAQTYTLAMPAYASDADASEDGWVYYVVPDGAGGIAWSGEATEGKPSVPGDVLLQAAAADAAKAKICAAFTSEFTGFGAWLTYGSYKVYADNTASSTTITIAKAARSDAELAGAVGVPAADRVVITVDPGTGKVANISTEAGADSGDFASAALKYFNIDLGTYITAANVKTNFGWKNKVEACYAWGTKAAAIVDVNNKTEVPKTGDSSVLALAGVLAGVGMGECVLFFLKEEKNQKKNLQEK